MHQVLRSLRRPERLRTSVWASASLVARRLRDKPETPVLGALQQIFDETLAQLDALAPDHADLLRGRYWEGLTSLEMMAAGRPKHWSDSYFFERQRLAVTEFAHLLWDREQQCRANQADEEEVAIGQAESSLEEERPTLPIRGRGTARLLASGAVVGALAVGTLSLTDDRLAIGSLLPRRIGASLPHRPPLVEPGRSPSPGIPQYPPTTSTLDHLTGDDQDIPRASHFPATASPDPSPMARIPPPSLREPSATPEEGIILIAPAVASMLADLVTFQWAHLALNPNAVFDVRVCHGASCNPLYGKTQTQEAAWTWCPDAGPGVYRWQVVVVAVEGVTERAPRSSIGDFTWSGGGCAAAYTDQNESMSNDENTGPDTGQHEPPGTWDPDSNIP